jgi:hypothetical protein
MEPHSIDACRLTLLRGHSPRQNSQKILLAVSSEGVAACTRPSSSMHARTHAVLAQSHSCECLSTHSFHPPLSLSSGHCRQLKRKNISALSPRKCIHAYMSMCIIKCTPSCAISSKNDSRAVHTSLQQMNCGKSAAHCVCT